MVKVNYSHIPDLLDETVLPKLSEYRQNKLSSINCKKTRRQGICAELLLEKSVSPYFQRPLPICVSDMGKPYFETGKIYFSISHSGDIVACALADVELGFDIQKIKDFDERFARRFYCEDELEYIESSHDKDIAFTEIWCKKESYLKAIGLGLRIELNSFSVMKLGEHFRSGIMENMCFSVFVPSANNYIVNIEEKLL